MRKLVALGAAILVAFALASPAWAQSTDKDCADFASQADAQAELRSDPTDPHGLDALAGPADGNDDSASGGHGDGIACESNPEPFDLEPVFAEPTPTTAPPTTAPPTTEAPTTTAPPALPFTGPNDVLLPAGTLLAVIGFLALAVTRKRGKHQAR